MFLYRVLGVPEHPTEPAVPSAPSAPRIPSVRELDGETDDYAWMRDHSQIREYLAAERAYYDARTHRLGHLTSRLCAESAGRVPEADESVGWSLSGFIYRTRTPEGRENLQFVRSRSGESAEEVLLDENIISDGYVEVGVREVSPDGSLLAWSADTTGAEIYRMRIRDLRTGTDLPDVIERTYPGAAWSADSRHLYYLVPDEVNRPFQVWRHQVGSPHDSLVYVESDARFELELWASRSGSYAVVTSASRDTTEVRLISLTGTPGPGPGPVLVRPRQRGLEYRVDHARTGSVFVVTNLGATEFTLNRTSTGQLGEWADVASAAAAPARADTRLHVCDAFADHLLLTLRRDGAPLLAITDHDGGSVREVTASTPAASLRVEHAEEYDAGSVIIAEESLIEPPAWYRLDLATGERTLLKRKDVPGYDPAPYRTERVFAPARDGTPIPVTLAYRLRPDGSAPLDGTAPCLLYGYGAYESCADPKFDVGLPSLLDRGVVYAIAHIRGGGEGGRRWWLAGRLRSKPATFTDFIDVADWLAGDRGGGGPALVDGSRIVARGLSAGGLLMGAVYSQRPDRWAAVVAEVPFVDCVTTMLDETIPLTINEWDEWGDPRDPGDYACIRSYSPYDNPPPAGRRPPLLVTGAVNDPRVGVHEPAKWVAKLRATDPDTPVLFRAELGAGAHTGPSGRFAQLAYRAEVHAFVLDAMGISE
jgi:oligopeptidase B